MRTRIQHKLTRRAFLNSTCLTAAAAAGCQSVSSQPPRDSRLNVLLLTSDDLNYDSPGFMGCRVPDITPNLDGFARGCLRFDRGHVTVASCQPSRQCMMTGRYPHNMDAPGFDPIAEDVTTLQERLHAIGYLNGILGKETHLAPPHKFCWDQFTPASELGRGRDPQRYYEESKSYLERAKSEGKPFFLMANSHDPHRPLAGSDDEIRRWNEHLPVSRTIRPEEVEVPDFLPDIPGVREDIAAYFTSAHRSDESMGAVLRALEETGFAENTLVMYLSDNGMAFPFAKANCYLTSTRTPWLVRWPGVTHEGAVDTRHFISGVDYMPTILEALGLEPESGLDGRSFSPLLRGHQQEGRDHIYTLFNRLGGEGRTFPMRAMQNERFGYIWNAWANGQTKYTTSYFIGPAFEAMKALAETDAAMAERWRSFIYRRPDEFYDFGADPAALNNLVDGTRYRRELHDLRERLRAEMRRSNDPLLPDFETFLAQQS